MLTNVQRIPNLVTITPTALIQRVPTAVGANQGSLEMEKLAKVVNTQQFARQSLFSLTYM